MTKESEDLMDLDKMLELCKDLKQENEEEPVEELPLEEISENDYMRRWYKALNHFQYYGEQLTKDYKSKMNQVNEFIQDLYQQIQEVHLYGLDHRIKYFYNPNKESLMFIPTYRKVGFEDEV